MISKIKLAALALPIFTAFSASAALQSYIPMDLSSGAISDIISGQKAAVKGQFAPESVAGAFGNAVYFDGYSSRADLPLNNIFPENTSRLTFSLVMAVPCYPIVEIDKATSEKATIVSCLDPDNKKGFGLFLGMDGKVEFRIFVGGWLMNVESNRPVAPYEWNQIAAVLNDADHTLTLYINGDPVGSNRCNGSIDAFSGILRFGYGSTDRYAGPFDLMAFNGIIDDVKISDEALSPDQLKAFAPENPCNLSIPASRFENQALRPRFHGMPGAAWTNESHGMTKGADGRYHVFFQKNANGPYMARLHWGHISSPNLFDWQEEKIAFAPSESYDFKGCWSGCVFSDNELTGGKPAALYTAVDYVKASIAMATPQDDALINWTKTDANPLINGRPAGLSDDFRDPYFFRNGDKAYIIVGTSKDGKGATTLHRYSNGSFSNDGSIFFAASNTSTGGTFWEMPNITKIGEKWLFTATPLGLPSGVSTIYFTGSINPDGTFQPDANSAWPRRIELISKDGYGLLSPTICQDGDKTLMLGIVPDKLPGDINYKLGWAHCYSLPREISLDSEGNLLQRPYEGLKQMRGVPYINKSDFNLSGSENLNPADVAADHPGVHAELLMSAIADSSEFGFKIFKGTSGEASVSIDCASSRLNVDLTGLQRYHNDDRAYAGVYSCTLPKQIQKGEEVTLNLFIDGSILDIFINNRWATSIRVFPTADDALGLEAFASAPTSVKSLAAWTLRSADPSGVNTIEPDRFAPSDRILYNASGIPVGCLPADSDPDHAVALLLSSLPKGVYILGSRKFIK